MTMNLISSKISFSMWIVNLIKQIFARRAILKEQKKLAIDLFQTKTAFDGCGRNIIIAAFCDLQKDWLRLKNKCGEVV